VRVSAFSQSLPFGASPAQGLLLTAFSWGHGVSRPSWLPVGESAAVARIQKAAVEVVTILLDRLRATISAAGGLSGRCD